MTADILSAQITDDVGQIVDASAGDVTVYNGSPSETVLVSPSRSLPPGRSFPLGPGRQIAWPAGLALYGRSSVTGATVYVLPGGAAVLPSSVDEVTSRVPTLTRDVMFWPCIDGEAFPPSFLNSAGYGSFVDSPTVFANVGGPETGPTEATWPTLPRTGSAGHETMTVSGKLLFDYQAGIPAGQWIDELLQIGNPTGSVAPEVAIEARTDIGVTFTIASDVYPNSTKTIPLPASDIFHDFAVVIDPAGFVTIEWDGAQILTGPSEWTPGSVPLQIVALCQCSTAGLVGEIDLTRLQVAWS